MLSNQVCKPYLLKAYHPTSMETHVGAPRPLKASIDVGSSEYLASKHPTGTGNPEPLMEGPINVTQIKEGNAPEMRTKQVWQFYGENSTPLPFAISCTNDCGIEAWAKIFPIDMNQHDIGDLPALLRNCVHFQTLEQSSDSSEAAIKFAESSLNSAEPNKLAEKTFNGHLSSHISDEPPLQTQVSNLVTAEKTFPTTESSFNPTDETVNDTIKSAEPIVNKKTEPTLDFTDQNFDTKDFEMTDMGFNLEANEVAVRKETSFEDKSPKRELHDENCKSRQNQTSKLPMRKKYLSTSGATSVTCFSPRAAVAPKNNTTMRPSEYEFSSRLSSPDPAPGISRTGLFSATPRVAGVRPADPMKPKGRLGKRKEAVLDKGDPIYLS